jgi:hypothetical protein
MTTSFTRTRTQIAQRVLGKVIKLGASAALSSDADTVYEAIDLRLKGLHERGIFWRKVTSVPVTFSLDASVATASAGAGDILFPIRVTFSDGDRDDPVALINAREYAAIEDKTRTGPPAKVLWKGGSEFIFYPVPESNGTAKLLYEKIADDTSSGAAIDIDVAMIRPMIDLVKYDVADDYGIPETTMARWEREAMRAERSIHALARPRTDLATVAVDDWTGVTHTETDYEADR